MLAILAGANAVALQIFLQETYHPVRSPLSLSVSLFSLRCFPLTSPRVSSHLQVLEARIRNPTPKLSLTESLRHVWATRGAVTSKLSVALKRPPTMLFTDGVLAVSCIYYAFIYANLFLFLVSVSPPLETSSHLSFFKTHSTALFVSLRSDPHPLPRG